MEGAGDFKALRAMFQNNSNSSNALPQPQKNPSAEIMPRQNIGGSSTSTSKHRPFRQVPVPNLEKKTEQLPCVVQKSEMMHVKPVVLPRVKIRELPEMSKNEYRKDFPETLARGTELVVEPQNQRPKSCLYPQETAAANNSFHHTLRIWESASSQNDPKCSVVPLPYANRTMLHGQSRPSNVAVIAEVKAKTVESEQALILATSNNPPQSDPTPSPAVLPLIPPRRPVSLQITACGAPKNTGYSSLNADALDRQSKSVQCSNEMHHVVEEIKLPKTKPLPSAVSLGPPPKKPPRPPRVDLSNFQRNPPDAGDDAYVTPENTATEGQSIYDETISCPKQPGSSTCSFTVQESMHSSKAEKSKDTKKLIATPSTEMEDVKKRGPLWDHQIPRQQANEMGKIGGHGGMLAKVKINGESRGGKNMLQEETTQSFPGTRLVKAGNYGYVSLETLKMDEEKSQTRELDPRTPPLVSAVEELYDDVEGLVQASDTISSFMSDTFSEETYEDIQSEDYNSTKLDVKVEKPKKFGKLFKKGKFHMKNIYLKENSRNLSSSVPNLDVMAQEGMLYDDIGTEQDDTKEKNEIHKNWKLKFLTSKEKGRRRSSDEAEITPSRNFFKAKKNNLEKNNKEAKEEKWFREKFMYEKKIKVINTAVAGCSNTSTKSELDLPITAGEQLEVIDITKGNQLICRNADGKCINAASLKNYVQ